ncbi:craniofacial development protein 1 isoform X2 [Rhinatrema bivittatum]|uniref:craniofacial development protein 1 isoform X2 n=1 Tax=Rhinatrema bivittatum TaxID=194408 RepID=UPI00112CA730|nr:craniofacial development protein 1 isoform X2 [Rhinatrema bivittatum]
MAMAGSNSDSEDYCSSEDEDYVPSGEDYSEDDVNELVKEDDPNEDEEDVPKGRGKKRSSKSALVRKRKKGDLLLEPEEGQAETETLTADGRTEETGDLMRKKNVAVTEEEKKKKDDELWASFLSDVGKEPKVAPPVVSSRIQETKPAGKSQESHSRTEEETPEIEDSIDASKVKITKVFDFAGEEIRVTKEVDASSKEAKCFLKQQEKERQDLSSPPVPAALPTGSGVKRSSGLSSIMGKLGNKKQKMSTLEKSKLDWENFKEEEGIGDELAIYNRGKEGYIERKAFLDRVDYRQF